MHQQCSSGLACRPGLERFVSRSLSRPERDGSALNEAACRCESVIFLISKTWLASPWCKNELNLARRLNKWLFGVLVEESLTIRELPSDVISTWQPVDLARTGSHAASRRASHHRVQRKALLFISYPVLQGQCFCAELLGA
jgi:hypothetical protein